MTTKTLAPNMKHDEITPYETGESKKDQVARMFDNIAGKYDFLNHFFSVGIDKRWRKKAIASLRGHSPQHILDVATGTGDFAIETVKINPKHIIGVDISAGMLDVGRKKIRERGLTDMIEFVQADSEDLPFPDDTFDAITVSFGVRNFQNLKRGLSEMYRVLKPGGRLVILEFSKPRKFPLKQGYFAYFKYIMPTVGRLVSKDKSAYRYLPQSVLAFPEGKNFENILHTIGYEVLPTKTLTGGIASIYSARKVTKK